MSTPILENDVCDLLKEAPLETLLLIMPPGGEEEERNAEANRAAIMIVARNNLISYLSLSLSISAMLFLS